MQTPPEDSASIRTEDENSRNKRNDGASELHSGVSNVDDGYTDLLRDQPSLPRFPLSDVRASPYILPKGFQWSLCDLNDEDVCREICKLQDPDEPEPVHNSRIEDLRRSLCPPGYLIDWHVGVYNTSSVALVGFVAAFPTRIRVRDAIFRMAECACLFIEPIIQQIIPPSVLMNEILRRVNLKNIWQQVYCGSSLLPAPIAVSQLWARPLNLRKLHPIIEPTMSMNQMSEFYPLPDSIETPGFRRMKMSDVPAVTALLRNHLSQFVVAPVYTEDEVKHWMLPRENVLDSFVVETLDEDHEITDFCSYSIQEELAVAPAEMSLRKKIAQLSVRFTIQVGSTAAPARMSSTNKIAQLFYHASTRTPLAQLMRDALVAAKQDGCDVFVAVDFMNNENFLEELHFKPNRRSIQYNLNNYALNVLKSSEVGLLLS